MKLYAAALLLQVTAALAKDCSSVCPAIYKPVCAVDAAGEKRTFSNQCQLNIYTCNNGEK